jgi:hypothetical protein
VLALLQLLRPAGYGCAAYVTGPSKRRKRRAYWHRQQHLKQIFLESLTDALLSRKGLHGAT